MSVKGGNSTKPECPTCSGPMVLRTSAHGQFYGCRSYPRCKGTARLGGNGPQRAAEAWGRGDRQQGAAKHAGGAGKGSKSLLGGMVITRKVPQVVGSPEQCVIWDSIAQGNGHAMVQARAGTGKSFTIFHAACRVDEALQVGVLAFNKTIAAEMQGRFDAAGVGNCKAVTFHSLGYGAIRRAYGSGVAIDNYKLRNIAEGLLPAGIVEADKLDDARGNLAKLAGMAKNYMADSADMLLLTALADKHNLELGENAALVLGLIGAALEQSWALRQQAVDFDDMLYVAVRGGLRPEQFDLLMVDEAQDTNAVQIELGLMAVKPTGRVVIVGDEKQSIYGWRGSHTDAMRSLASRLHHGHAHIAESDVNTFPLTVTRRCGRFIVRLAQCLVPDITALPDAPDGTIRERVKWEAAVGEMAPGDMVLCRVNRYLVPVAYALLRRGVKAVIRGRDIGANVTALMAKVLKTAKGGYKGSKAAQDSATVREVLTALTAYREREETRLMALGKNGAGRLESMTDQCDTLVELCEGCGTVAEVKGKVAGLFADFDPAGKPNTAVVCSTVHGAKGLEAERVYVLNTELMPHPRATRDWEVEQERNLIYVAVTRAKAELMFVAGKPGQWKGGDGAAPACLREGMEAIASGLAEQDSGNETCLALDAEMAAEGSTKLLTAGAGIDDNGEETDAEDMAWLSRREAKQALADEPPF